MVAAIALFSPFLTIAAPPPADPRALSRLYFGLQPATDREAERGVEVLQELIDAGRHAEAAPLLQRVLAAPADHFGADGGSLKRRAIAVALGLEPHAIVAITDVLAPTYRREASHSRDADALHEVVARYPPELFGSQTLVALAEAETDRGGFRLAAEAAAWAASLNDDGGPKASIPAARLEVANRLRMGDESGAEAAAARLGRDGDSMMARFGAATRGAAERWREGEPPRAWRDPHGAVDLIASRVAKQPPAGWLRWKSVFYDAGDRAAERDGDVLSVPDLPAPLPPRSAIATGGRLVVADRGGLVGLDVETGKRLWRVTSASASAAGALARGWARGGLSATRRLVFVVGAAANRPSESLRPRREVFPFGQDSSTATPLPPNTLSAYELAAEGKLRWRLDGADPASELSGAAFLGPPAVDGPRLYALAEIDQSITLVELRAADGAVLWRQPLVRCERAPRLAVARIGATPVIAGRWAYCVTGRGAIVAVDLLRRDLAWIHDVRVGRHDEDPPSPLGSIVDDIDPPLSSWSHCRAVPAGDLLMVATSATSDLIGLERATGELRWRSPMPTAQLLAGVAGEMAIVVEEHRVTAVDPVTGERTGSLEIPDGAEPVGEGLMIDDGYVTPLTTGRAALAPLSGLASGEGAMQTIDLGLNPLEPRADLGVLLSHRGVLVSARAEGVYAYDFPSASELAPGRDRAAAALAAGDPASAREAIQGADLADSEARELLAAATLADERSGGGGSADFRRLAAGFEADAQATLMAIEAAKRDGELAEARRLARDMVQRPASRVVLEPEPGLAVTAGRLASGPLLATYAEHSEARRSRVTRSGAWSTHRVRVGLHIDPAPADPEPTSNRLDGARRSSRPYRVEALGAAGPRSFWVSEVDSARRLLLIRPGSAGDRTDAIATPESFARFRLGPSNSLGDPGPRWWREWFALPTPDGYLVSRWRALPDADSSSGRGWRSSEAPHPAWARPITNERVERPVAIGPWGVVSCADRTLVARSIEDGLPLWRRRLSSPLGHALTAGDDLLVRTESDDWIRLSLWTGADVGGAAAAFPPEPSTWRTWRAHAHGWLLVEDRRRDRRRWRVFDLNQPDREEPIWGRELDETTRVGVIDGAHFVTVDAAGRATLFDLGTGAVRFETDLPVRVESAPAALRGRIDGDRLLLQVDRALEAAAPGGFTPLGSEPLVSGELHCIDASTGSPLWAAPVELSGLAVLDLPIEDSPIVLLGRREDAPQGPAPDAAGQTATLVAIDAATGVTLARRKELPRPETDPGGWPVWAMMETTATEERVIVRVGRARWTLATTEVPAPPRPPLTSRVEDPSRPLLEGLFRVFGPSE